MYHCRLCGATWSRRNRRALLSQGPCPGSNLWLHDVPPSLEAPWIYPRGAQIPVIWKGHVVSLSHRLQFYRGCLYCNVCGAYSARHFAPALAAACLLRPASDRGQRRLNSMRRGVWPAAGDWPLPPQAQAPQGFIILRDAATDASAASSAPHPP